MYPHIKTRKRSPPGTAPKADQNVGMLAGNVSGAGVQGAKNEYEHAPLQGKLKIWEFTDPGTTFDYSPSTEQMQDTGLSAASTAAGYAPSGKIKEAGSTGGPHLSVVPHHLQQQPSQAKKQGRTPLHTAIQA
ncbi:hypothetical protein BDQ17DRAFT_1337765 [Cyathus striatus]|nr:hypothetical protein BDQ17DRAFT_1337765 [Cyathus striatus]